MSSWPCIYLHCCRCYQHLCSLNGYHVSFWPLYCDSWNIVCATHSLYLYFSSLCRSSFTHLSCQLVGHFKTFEMLVGSLPCLLLTFLFMTFTSNSTCRKPVGQR